ncbi:MAG: S8 family peptidase [Magnetococcales bacterium]|nr:S8 family peptidase [Magnetococcales bacterium]
MTERPLLILPVPGAPVERKKKRGGNGKFGLPSCQRQAERLAPRFQVLQDTFEKKQAALRTDVTGVSPEDVLVLETVGTVEKFISALQRVEGMEWMGEIELENIPPDDDFFSKNDKGVRTEKPMRGAIFLVLTNHRAWGELNSLWDRWKRGESLGSGHEKFKELFAHLHDIRPWGVQDRLRETGVMEDWQERLSHGAEVVPCEIELWFRSEATKRGDAQRQIEELLRQQGGKVTARAMIGEIGYHAILAEMPASSISQILNNSAQVRLVTCEQIQFFRASGQMAVGTPHGDPYPDNTIPPFPLLPSVTPPVAALLDGMPLQNHERLAGRLIIDDPDGFEADYKTSERRHGTAMASLILWGDLEAKERPVNHPLYVRPIMKPNHRDWNHLREESIPDQRLVVDVIHRAVRRMFDDDTEPASAKSVCLINLSIGIRDRPFEGAMSPLARLLDWLSWRYKVLFLVSAGNHSRDMDMGMSLQQFRNLPPSDRTKKIFQAVAGDARNRRLLSPAEALNVLTL